MGRGELKVVFPRIFALGRLKSRPVFSFKRWEEDGWRWEIALMRRVFDWEIYI